MVNRKALFDIIKYNHFSTKDVAYILNLSTKEFKKKLNRGIFQSNELEMMLHFLKFPVDPVKVFFDTYDPENPKKINWEPILENRDCVIKIDNRFGEQEINLESETKSGE